MVYIYASGGSDLTIDLDETLRNYNKIGLLECTLNHSWYNITE